MEYPQPPDWVSRAFHAGMVIPAHPLALTEDGRFDAVHQRALTRYYAAAGAGGVAVGVHTTQFEIRKPGVDLLKPVLKCAAAALDEMEQTGMIPSRRPAGSRPGSTAGLGAGQGAAAQPGFILPDATIPAAGHKLVRVAGVCGPTHQAVAEAGLAADLGYHAGLLSLAAMKGADDDDLIRHCDEVARTLPLVGFYLQPAVGGRRLSQDFWRRLAAIPNLIGIKIAPFNRYATLDVVRGVALAGRAGQVALYTGNDDNIVPDLLTRFDLSVDGQDVKQRIVGGLLGHWSVWTFRAVELFLSLRGMAATGWPVPAEVLALGMQVTDANAALFDAAHDFAGCIAGIQYVLHRQGMLGSARCLDPNAALSPGQAEEIDRVRNEYPHLIDDDFVAANLADWLA